MPHSRSRNDFSCDGRTSVQDDTAQVLKVIGIRSQDLMMRGRISNLLSCNLSRRPMDGKVVQAAKAESVIVGWQRIPEYLKSCEDTEPMLS